MSVKVGNILNGRKTYVAGAPRSRDSGQVLLFQPTNTSLKVEERHYLTGEQFGSCFGYDIAIADFNSDGWVDLTASRLLGSVFRGVQYVHWVMHKWIMVKVGGETKYT